jgi:polygalacturonase
MKLLPAIEQVERRYLLSNPTLPNITNHLSVLITQSPYNATTTSTNNTAAIQAAINAVNSAGGGTVEVPGPASGTTTQVYLFKTLALKSNVILQVDAYAELQAVSADSAGSIINGSPTNFEVIGLGTAGAGQGDIDGNGFTWYPNNGPNLFEPSNCSVGLFQNITISNSPHEHMDFSGSTNNITINNIFLDGQPESTAQNTDGIDYAGTNLLVENSTIQDGDDDIVAKPQSVACSNIIVTNCTINYGHGISIGGETNDGLNGMTVSNVLFNGTTWAFHLKAGVGQGGTVQNLTFSNISMTGVSMPLFIDSYYTSGDNFPTNPTSDTTTSIAALTPLWKNIIFDNITATGTIGAAGEIGGLPEQPIQGMQFINVNITAIRPLAIDHVRNTTFDSSSHFTIASGNDLQGTTNTSFPTPVDAQITLASYTGTNSPPATLPTLVGYTDTDIGSPTVPFDTSESLYDPNSTNWVLNGGGAGLAGSSDQFNYSYMPVSGASDFIAQLTGLTGPGGGAVPQAGVMYRASTNAGDAFAAVVQTTANKILFEYRTTSGGTLVASSPVSVNVGSAYLEVIRSGNNFSGWYSTNGGSTYTQIGSTISISAIPATADAGLMMSDNDNGAVSAATFANISSNLLTGPSIVTPAAANVAAAGTSITLTALGSDPAGASTLTYTWVATTVPNGVTTPTYDANNGTNAGQTEIATVYGIGTYTFQVTITDPSNLSVTSSANATVTQVLTSVSVTPSTLSLPVDSTYQFAAGALDQFGGSISGQTFTWTVTGVNNSITQAGLLTLDGPKNRAQVAATDGSVAGTAIVTPLAATAPAPAPITVTPIQTPSPPESGGTTGGGSATAVPTTPIAAPTTPTASTPSTTSTTTTTSASSGSSVSVPATPVVVVTPVTTTTTSLGNTATTSGPAVTVASPAVSAPTPTTTASDPTPSLTGWLLSHGLHGLATVGWHRVGWSW